MIPSSLNRQRLVWLVLPLAVVAVVGLWLDRRERTAVLAEALAAERATLAWITAAARELDPLPPPRPVRERVLAVLGEAAITQETATVTAESAVQATLAIESRPGAEVFALIHRLMAAPGLSVSGFAVQPVANPAGHVAARVVIRGDR